MANHRGDDGRSDLLGPDRPEKSHPVFDCLGWIDELSATVGLLRTEIRADRRLDERSNMDRELRSIQIVLGQIMGSVAWNQESDAGLPESELDRLESLDASLRSRVTLEPRFVIPGDGSSAAALSDLARARCRTAERSLVSLQSVHPGGVDLGVEQRYLNRLSDYLFILGRLLEQVTNG